MASPLVFVIVLASVTGVTALVPTDAGGPVPPTCPIRCLCVPTYSTAVLLTCDLAGGSDWALFCQQLANYSKVYPELSLQLKKSSQTGEVLQSLECLPSLEKLDMSSLGQSILGPDVLKSVIDVRHLNLSSNAISSLSGELFGRLPRLESLDVSHNLLQEIDSAILKNLPSLKELDMSFNQLVAVPTSSFASLLSLEVLNLEHNQLQDLTMDHLPPSRSLRVLNLRNNSLSSFILSVNVTANDTLQNVMFLDISQNPIECSCVLGELFSTLPSIRQSFVHMEETVCSSPEKLMGKLLTSVREEDLLCSVPKNVVTYPSSGQSIAIYHDITLECNSDGYPVPSNMWITPWGAKLYSGSVLPLLSQQHNETVDLDALASSRGYWDPNVFLHSRLELLDDQNLRITNFRGSFAGKYVCVSLNAAGNKNQSIDLSAHSKIKSVYLDSIFIGGYCASGFLIFGLIVGAIRNCVIRFRRHFRFRVPLFSKSPSEHKPDDTTDAMSANENEICKSDEENPESDGDGPGPSSPLHVCTSQSDEEDAPRSPGKPGSSSPWGWRPPAFLGSLEEARGRLRYGMGRRMDHLRKNVQSIKDSGTVYVHTLKESSSSAANKVKASMVYGVETVKSQVQSFKELCGTGNMGGQTISMMSVETDVDTHEQKDIIRQVTFV